MKLGVRLTWGDGALSIIDLLARETLVFAAVGIALGGLDDLAVDAIFLVRWCWTGLTRRGQIPVMLGGGSATDAQGRIAIFIPVWDEAKVIGTMLRSTLARLDFPDYRIFVGAYPNDQATIDAVAAVADHDDRIRLIIGTAAGPTTKGANLNLLWHALAQAEAADPEGIQARMIVLHDAEDVVHAHELRVFDRLIGRHIAVQLPVLPLVQAGSRLVSGHYCDEFAEAHGKQLVVRLALKAGLPLAGVGCAIARSALADVAARRGGDPFDAESLTEDYELGLQLSGLGGTMVLARVREYSGGPPVAVRAYFPATLDAAVRQKARWMIGIALAGWDRIGWGKRCHVADHWMRLRDRRAPIAVIILAAAYVAILASGVSVVSHWLVGTPPPSLAVPPALLLVNGLVLFWRLAVRAGFTGSVYGWKEAMWSLPRAVVGNLIAVLAASRALVRYVAMLRGRPLHWDKTAHVFPPDLAAHDKAGLAL